MTSNGASTENTITNVLSSESGEVVGAVEYKSYCCTCTEGTHYIIKLQLTYYGKLAYAT